MKTSLSREAIKLFLEKQLGEITNVQQLVEGEESQALSFRHAGEELVVRINPSIHGFEKDRYTYDHFASESIPIPRVVSVGQIDAKHAFCISERLSGITFQEADELTISNLLEPVSKLWEVTGAVDISSTSGFGEFDASGYGHDESWRDYLLSIADSEHYDWKKTTHADRELVDQLLGKLKLLVGACPEERHLVHGDFGANNVLVEGSKVTAILDWENALYGDPLYDVATAYFWRTWLLCMEKTAAHWEQELNTLPDYQNRILCYQLRIGLHEIYDNATDKDSKMLDWVQNRCREILANSNPLGQ